MNRFAAVLGALALASLGASTAGAQVATGTLTFLQPDGVVGANDIVPINVRLTLNSDSTTLAVDVDGRVTSGGPSDDEFLARNFDPSIPFQMRFLPSASCSGTFFPPNSCAAGNYSFEFKQPYLADFSLMAGQSLDFKIAEFTPKAGGAAPGVYNFYTAAFQISSFSLDANFNLTQSAIFDVGRTCFSGDDSCDFSRTVLGGGPGLVPEPATWALMIGGFGLAGAALRRRRAPATL